MEQASIEGKQAIDRLVGLGHMRVWSVIITIFGDAIVKRGGVAPSSTLATLSAQMGVKPEAFRVALSRLTKDGWIARSKQGRLSYYRLSPLGVSEFGPATRRIYASAPGSDKNWQLVLLPGSATDEIPKEAVRLGGRAYLVGPGDQPPDGLRVSGTISPVPGWVKERVGIREIANGYGKLLEALQNTDVRNLSDLQAATLRVLTVHQWRRLVLRHADLPERYFPQGWKGEPCRRAVHALLENLSVGADRWFDSQFDQVLLSGAPR